MLSSSLWNQISALSILSARSLFFSPKPQSIQTSPVNSLLCLCCRYSQYIWSFNAVQL